MTLRATIRRRDGSSAWNTAPMPPAPRRPRTRYGPSRPISAGACVGARGEPGGWVHDRWPDAGHLPGGGEGVDRGRRRGIGQGCPTRRALDPVRGRQVRRQPGPAVRAGRGGWGHASLRPWARRAQGRGGNGAARGRCPFSVIGRPPPGPAVTLYPYKRRPSRRPATAGMMRAGRVHACRTTKLATGIGPELRAAVADVMEQLRARPRDLGEPFSDLRRFQMTARLAVHRQLPVAYSV